MPRVVDHEERRTLIARTFQRHVLVHGLAATTFARVAASAGISVGLIQHYFTNRDELLRFVYLDALRRRDDRIVAHIAEGEAAERPIRDMLAAAVRELLPLDGTRTAEFHITQNLLTQALHDPEIAEVAVRADRDLHLRASVAVRNGKKCGEVEPDVDADTAAARILATAHGLAIRLALTRPPTATASTGHVDAVLGPILAAVFTGRCHHHDRSRSNPDGSGES
ncbi:transcriptional regulator, TetR family [Micromonospora sediminicola]|uniref:Transcriptional regulator, TetR family n=1 Tax=Micromonospora sediminicola TaxID=946078 RepID=A0A1A9BIM9_9ACTN|nr:TetR family transcriptional regulator C-terminal domain-containing protein [Micromonospora sediminicola]SBT68814.1 transcriptional regulator, TetR family [Micromonospora sediminicola]